MFRSIMAGMGRMAMSAVAATGRGAMWLGGRMLGGMAQVPDRLIPQGASEIANVLNAGHAYHPVAPYAPPLQRSSTIPRQIVQPQRGMEMEK